MAEGESQELKALKQDFQILTSKVVLVQKLTGQIDELKGENSGLRRALGDLESKFTSLETEFKAQDTKVDGQVEALTKENGDLKKKVRDLEAKSAEQGTKLKAMDDRKSTVFGVRLNLKSPITENNKWQRLNRLDVTYQTCAHFKADTCKYHVPRAGQYYVTCGFQQINTGGLEVRLFISDPAHSDKPDHSALVGLTNGANVLCDKGVVLSLSAGSKLYAQVRRRSGDAAILWSALYGYLLA